MSQTTMMPSLQFANWVVAEPVPLVITPREQEYLPTLVHLLLQIQIKTVEPVERVGSVYILNVEPKRYPDPRLIICGKVNLETYYDYWLHFSTNRIGLETRHLTQYKYKEMIQELDTKLLTAQEYVYLMLELHRYGNEHVWSTW